MDTPVTGTLYTGPGRYTWHRGAQVQQPPASPHQQLRHSPSRMYGMKVPSFHHQPWAQPLHWFPQGRTVRSQAPNRRPVAAHMTKAPYSAAACWVSAEAASHTSSQQVPSTVQLHGREGAGVVKTSTRLPPYSPLAAMALAYVVNSGAQPHAAV